MYIEVLAPREELIGSQKLEENLEVEGYQHKLSFKVRVGVQKRLSKFLLLPPQDHFSSFPDGFSGVK
jgi:hypothetical protein